MMQETVYFFDFDGTLMDSPMPTDANKKLYQKVRGREYPHRGWWSKAESLDMEIFNIQPLAAIEQVFRDAHDNPQHHAVLLTNRIYMIEKEIRKVLDKHRMYFEHYSFKATNDNKGQRILDIMQRYYPNVKNIVFFDDDQKHLDDTTAALAGYDYNLKLVKIKADATYLTQDAEIV